LVVTDGGFGITLIALSVVVGLLFVAVFFERIGRTSNGADSEHSLKGRRGLVDLLVFRHSQMTASFFVFGFQSHLGI